MAMVSVAGTHHAALAATKTRRYEGNKIRMIKDTKTIKTQRKWSLQDMLNMYQTGGLDEFACQLSALHIPGPGIRAYAREARQA